MTQSVKDFHTEIVKGLLDGYCSRKRLGRRPSISVKRFCHEHFPKYGDGNQHKCHYCQINKCRKDTNRVCKDCGL